MKALPLILAMLFGQELFAQQQPYYPAPAPPPSRPLPVPAQPQPSQPQPQPRPAQPAPSHQPTAPPKTAPAQRPADKPQANRAAESTPPARATAAPKPRLSEEKAASPAQAQPAASALSIAVSTKKKILMVRLGGTDVKKYTVAVGTKAHPTPTGQFTIKHIVWNPAWVPPPDAKWAKGKRPTPPDNSRNPMKVVKIFFQEPDYYIHGTGDEDTLGTAASHGCIRLSQLDAFHLGRYLMDRAGAQKNDAWYKGVFTRGVPADVHLPNGVPVVIGP